MPTPKPLGWSVGVNRHGDETGTFHLMVMSVNVAVPACGSGSPTSGAVVQVNEYGHRCRRCQKTAAHAARQSMLDEARKCGERERAGYHSMHGADVSDSPRWGALCKMWRSLAAGADFDAAAETARKEWREYAEENNRKVEAAPRLKTGPSSGHSVTSHRYTMPERIENDLIHSRNTYRNIMGE